MVMEVVIDYHINKRMMEVLIKKIHFVFIKIQNNQHK